MNFKKIIFLFLPCLLLWAAGAQAFTISPLKYVITLSPQSGDALEINIKNDQEENQNYSLKVLGAQQDARGHLIFGNDLSPAENWVKPKKNAIQVGPNEERAAEFAIEVPRTAKPGSYYLGLAAEGVKSAGEQGVGISGQLICLLLLQVAGYVEESLDVARWRTEKLTVDKNWVFDLEIKNSGVVELPVQFKLIIKNWRGKVVHEEWADLGLLLPQAGRIFHAEVEPAKDKNFFSGPHKATLQLVYGRTGQIRILTTNFWRLSPAGLIILGLFLITVLIFLFKIRNRLIIKLRSYLSK